MHTRYAQDIYKELAHNESSCIQIQNQHPQHIWVVIKKLGTYTIRKLTSHHCHGAQYMLRIHTQDMHKICVQDLFIFVYYVYNFKGMIWKIRLFFSFFPCSDHGILRLKGVKILCESLDPLSSHFGAAIYDDFTSHMVWVVVTRVLGYGLRCRPLKPS